MHTNAHVNVRIDTCICNIFITLIDDSSQLMSLFLPLLYFLQAAEKFLRSAVYMKDSKHYNHHFLGTIAFATENSTLQDLAGQIESLLRGSAALRYPNRWCYPSIPHDKYDATTAEKALKVVKEIFTEVDKVVN